MQRQTERVRDRDGDTDRGRIKKKLRKGREEAILQEARKQKGCCTNMRKIYHGTYLTISHSSLS